DERDLLRIDVRDVELVFAPARHPEPESLVAQRQAHAVLSELDIAREQLRVDFVREHRVEIAVDVALETGTIARRGDLRLRDGRRRCDRQTDDGEPTTPHTSFSFTET